MTAKYIKCDGCGETIDRRPAGDHTNGGHWGKTEGQNLRTYARSIGWQTGVQTADSSWDSNDYCPACKPVKP
jgi:hypothetical protein